MTAVCFYYYHYFISLFASFLFAYLFTYVSVSIQRLFILFLFIFRHNLKKNYSGYGTNKSISKTFAYTENGRNLSAKVDN